MVDDLEAFRDGSEQERAAVSVAIIRDALVFEFEGTAFGIEARHVEGVIAYRPPAPIPQGNPGLRGVVQDTGRIISVLGHPAARAHVGGERVVRIVVCSSSKGLLGLPATGTSGVQSLSLAQIPDFLDVIDTPGGAITWLEPDQVARVLLGETG